MSSPISNHSPRRPACGVTTMAAVAAMTSSTVGATSSDHLLESWLNFSLQTISELAPTTDPSCPLKLVIVGAGRANLLGAVHDDQSHCIRQDGSFDGGVFTLTGAALSSEPGGTDSGDSITGQYRGRLVPSLPTSKSIFTNPPAGFWLIYGEICILKGTGRYSRVRNDCPDADQSGHWFPARGTTDLDTGQANIFATALVRVGQRPR